jgi:hypothetical protein
MKRKTIKKYPKKYVPKKLTSKDKKTQKKMIDKSRQMYKQGKYFTRKKVASYDNKTSPHILNARKIYGVEKIIPSEELAEKTGCSIEALDKIVKKGEGAYYSSGSRPNQTGHSWGYARMASAITSGKAAAVDYNILKEGCKPSSKALKLANKSRKKHKFGQRKVPKTI